MKKIKFLLVEEFKREFITEVPDDYTKEQIYEFIESKCNKNDFDTVNDPQDYSREIYNIKEIKND